MKSKPNHLLHESSPYLQQHAYNPVNWYPWGTEALDKARREKRPIFLSIGYSACHWCHVMEHESFEDAETAEALNRDFVSIKVDREERPDIDHIYMSAVQAMTQHGGWPLSVFLTPDLKPFYGGTYFPPVDRPGMPSFKRILAGLAQAWKARPEEVTQNAARLTQAVQEIHSGQSGIPAPQLPTIELLDAGVAAIARSFDSAFGGMGSAPKFFHTMCFRLCLRHWHRTGDATALHLVTYTLDQLSRGGIRDQLAGGFHRYSTDAEWLVPHFEKMLYDNALLTELYLETYQATRRSEFATVARSTLDYVLREMTSDEGGFFSTQDADSEGIEGKFYVWAEKEVLDVLGKELGTLFCEVYDISASGNWDGNNIPRMKQPLSFYAKKLEMDPATLEDELSVARRKLLAARSGRIAPGRDEKILLSWNGLMLRSLALGHQVLQDERYLEAAQKSAHFLLKTFTAPQPLPSGKLRLLHSHKEGKTRFNAYLDDYAFLLSGLVTLYESDFNAEWIVAAVQVADTLIDQFWSAKESAFYYTGLDHEALIARPKELQDGATPAGSSIAVTALLKLSRVTGKTHYEDLARAALASCEPYLRLIPTGMSQMLIALEMSLEPSIEVALFPGKNPEEWEEILGLIRECFLPHTTFASPGAGATNPVIGLLEARQSQDDKLTAFVCQQQTCLEPLVGVDAVRGEVQRWSKPSRRS